MFAAARRKLISFLKQGISAQKLALTLAAGLYLGTIPLLGSTSVLCALAALRLRLNMAVIQAINYLVYPLQLLLFVPFIKVGLMIFGNGKFNYTVKQVLKMLSVHPWRTITKLFAVNMLGVLVWLICMPLICWIVYLFSKRAFERIEKRS